MKTKLYTILIGLLMAACITSYGQEIVSEFSPNNISIYSNIVETSDNHLLVGSCTNLYNREYVVYKTTPEGSFMDSVVFYNEYQLLEIPSVTDTFLLVGFSIDNPGNIYSLKLTCIDDDLNTINEASIPIGEHLYRFWDYNVFITPNLEIVFPYSIGNGDKFHIMRLGLDLNVIEDKTIPEIARGTWNNNYTSDSVMFYTDISISSETPLKYHCLGYYKDATGNVVFVNHVLDSDFNWIESTVLSPYDESSSFTEDVLTAYTPINSAQSNERFNLMTTYLTSPNYSSSAIIKYNDKNDPVAMLTFMGGHLSLGLGQLVAKDYNTIYFTHGCFGSHTASHLVRLNGDLDIAWELPLPCQTGTVAVLNCLKVLENNDILVGAILYYQNLEPKLKIYIIRDDDPTTIQETATFEKPFTLCPNPVKDLLTLRFDDGDEPESVELYDLAGRLVGTKPNGLESIDMRAMPSGVYMLRVTMKDETIYHEKVLKE
jgi:hypothetical protein